LNDFLNSGFHIFPSFLNFGGIVIQNSTNFLSKKGVLNSTVPPYINNNIIVDPDPNKCADVVSAISTLGEIIEKTLAGGVNTVPISYPDYIDGKNTIFELYYEDGTGVSTDPNENLFIGIGGVIQHDSSYSIDRTSVPNKVVFTSLIFFI